jgi:hypothetical protein
MPSVPDRSGCDRNRIPPKGTEGELPHGHSVHVHRLDFTLRPHSGDTVPIEANLRYDTEDPLAVTLSFLRDGVEPVDWVLGRDLLVGGMALVVGDGDVRIHPDEDDPLLVWFHLEVPPGRVALTGCRRQLISFLDCTANLVPLGQEAEWMRIDASITRIFTEDRDDLPES